MQGSFFVLSRHWLIGRLSQNDAASLIALGGLTLWTGGFLFLYGPHALKTAQFPVLFLLFMVPVPDFVMNTVVYGLQVGSCEVTDLLFKIAGLAYVRTGFVFHLPNISIEVARQCSGIRSTIGLVITGVLAGHLFLDRGWGKLVLCAGDSAAHHP